MSIFRILPILAVGTAMFMAKSSMKGNIDVAAKVKVATTSGIEMEGICDLVVTEFLEEGKLPSPERFAAFLKENTQVGKTGGGGTRDRSQDPWGTPYRLKVIVQGFELQSAGPDKNWGSDDDITITRSLKEVPGGLAVMPGMESPQHTDAGTVTAPRLTPVATATNTTAAPKKTYTPLQTPEETARKLLEFQKQQAEKGSAYGQYEMALRYLEGRGVEQDPQKGRELLEKAAQNGHNMAMEKLEALSRAQRTAK